MSAQLPVLGHAGERVDLLIRQGATFGPHEVTLTNPDNTAVDLTGATVRAQLRRQALTPGAPLASFAITMIDAAGGRFSFGLTDEQTAAIPAGETPAGRDSRAVWDMELEDAAGRVTALFYGDVVLHREVTRA